MRKWYSILVFFVACSPERVDSAGNIAIFGLWEAGQQPVLHAILIEDDQAQEVSGQSFELMFPDGEKAPFLFSGSSYMLQSDRLPQSGERLLLRWFQLHDTAVVIVDMPPAISNIMVINDTLQTSEAEKCSIIWDGGTAGNEFALSLSCLESAPLPLPWMPGNFSQLYSGPQVATQLTLQPTDFGYLGTHQLTISVLNEELRDVFFFDLSDIRGLLESAPDNVSGGLGFVTGVSKASVMLEIE